MPKLIQYRYAKLLLWAAIAMVANPVWHGASHLSSDHLPISAEHVSDVQLSEHERCPYCDAVSSIAEAPSSHSTLIRLVRLEDISPDMRLYADLRHRLSTRLRAPPAVA